VKYRLMDVLACPYCKTFPLTLVVLREKGYITSTTSICNAVFKPYPTTHVFIVPYYLFLTYAVIGLLFTIYAAVKYVLKQTRKLPI